ncbi:MAG: hypothetical protein GWN58_27740 [Anaerolineae bacterium]|nr:hypothetical protein [Anaerolineae bacterium]
MTFLFSWLRRKEQGYPNEALIEAAVLPYIQRAILAAYKASEAVMDGTGERLHGLDKAKIAAAVYAAIPASVRLNLGGYQLDIPVGKLVTLAQFEVFVERVFADFLEWYEGSFDRWGDAVLEHLGEPMG